MEVFSPKYKGSGRGSEGTGRMKDCLKTQRRGK